jgi:cytochrome b pre-mRNA-processing protein 3
LKTDIHQRPDRALEAGMAGWSNCMMWKRLFGRPAYEQEAYAIYGALVSQARNPALYLHAGVPDTLEGRFEMVSLHAFLVLRRLRKVSEAQAEAARALGQKVFDVLFDDMDQTLREIGISDLKVGKEIKYLAEAFYGRIGAYDAALDSPDAALLASALVRNVYAQVEPAAETVDALAAYVRRAEQALMEAPVEQLLKGEVALAALPQPDVLEEVRS